MFLLCSWLCEPAVLTGLESWIAPILIQSTKIAISFSKWFHSDPKMQLYLVVVKVNLHNQSWDSSSIGKKNDQQTCQTWLLSGFPAFLCFVLLQIKIIQVSDCCADQKRRFEDVTLSSVYFSVEKNNYSFAALIIPGCFNWGMKQCLHSVGEFQWRTSFP